MEVPLQAVLVTTLILVAACALIGFAAWTENGTNDTGAPGVGRINVKGESKACPCSEERFCERIKDTTRKEVFVFSLRPKNKEWVYYNWDKVTTVVMVGYMDVDLVCHAHIHGARAITIGAVDFASLPDKSARASWIQKQLDMQDQYYLDGLNFDLENAILPNQSEYRDGYTAIVRETREAFRMKYPTSMVSVDVAWSPDHIDQRYYDYVGLSEAADLLFVMAYDEQSQIPGDCIAGANSGYPRSMGGVQKYLGIGVPADKMILGVPWYGYNYPCLSVSETNVCTIKRVPFRGVNCSDAAGKQVNYDYTLRLLRNSSTGRVFDDVTQSPYFNYLNKTSGQTHQVWYDDPVSLKIKYKYAVDQNMRGVGMWNTECVNYASQDPQDILAVKQMWDALPIYK